MNFNNKDILEFARLYPKFLDADDLAHELDTFAKLKKMDDFKDCKTLEDVCKAFSKNSFLKTTAYPNLYKAYKIAATLAVGTAGVERSFSSLKIIKDWLRSTM